MSTMRSVASQLHGVDEHTVSDSRPKSALGDHIDVALEQNLKIHQQPTEIKQAAVWIEVDEEVDVADCRGFTTGD